MTRCVLFFAALAAAAAEAPFTVAGLGDGEKITKSGAVPPSPLVWDAHTGILRIDGGRNEVLGAQLILTAKTGDVAAVNVEIGDLKGPGTIPSAPNVQLYRELYQYVTHADWEGSSDVLPDNLWYPDALAPFRDPYGAEHKPVGAPFDIAVKNGPNQGVWIDVYVPRIARPGRYRAPISITAGGRQTHRLTLELTVHSFTLPDETHVDGYGEFYGQAYGFHGADYARAGVEKWWAIAKRYHQMAHQHRFVVGDRRGRGPDERNWADYDKTYGTILDGSLFTTAEGYVGPGAATGVTFWRAPFAQAFDGRVPAFTDEQLRTYTAGAKAYREHLAARGWDARRIFAYIVDEPGRMDPRSVAGLKKLQDALDEGAGKGRINLIWTSHTNPATLASDPATDLRGIIRWWAPNGRAADGRFLTPRVREGETAWFYHHGHPCVGVHAVNATGVELRTWGNICWRYQISGSFWWAMDLSDAKDPMNRPIYSPRETRWGNGVLFYSGARLPDVGLPAIDGPVSSLRMKAYRRGLQDYEYGWLLKQAGRQAVADEAVRRVIPVALAEALPEAPRASGAASEKAEQAGRAAGRGSGRFRAPWRTDVNDWYRMHADLAAALDAAKSARGR